MFRVFWLLPALMILAACAAGAPTSATPVPTPQIWYVAFTSELSWLAAEFDGCLPPGAQVGIVVEETQTMQPEGTNADLLLHWGEIDPRGLPAYTLGFDSLIVIMHPENKSADFGIEDLRQVYSGEVTTWDSLSAQASGGIHAWVYPAHLVVQQVFEEQVSIAQSGTTNFNIAPDVAAMLAAVASDPNAIGFIPLSWLDSSVLGLEVAGWEPPQVPVVLLASVRPDAAQQDWSACLAEMLKHNNP